MDSAQLEVQLTMHRKVFGSLPALHSANVPMQVAAICFHPRKAAPTSVAEANRGGADLETSGAVVGVIVIYDKERRGVFDAERRLCGRNYTPSLP